MVTKMRTRAISLLSIDMYCIALLITKPHEPRLGGTQVTRAVTLHKAYSAELVYIYSTFCSLLGRAVIQFYNHLNPLFPVLNSSMH